MLVRTIDTSISKRAEMCVKFRCGATRTLAYNEWDSYRRTEHKFDRLWISCFRDNLNLRIYRACQKLQFIQNFVISDQTIFL